MTVTLYTVGHSNQTLDQFLTLLHAFQIRRLVDVRRFPSSRRYPHFNRENLAESLSDHKIEYLWCEALGGRRQSEASADSPNLALRDPGFRHYADYMMTQPFTQAIDHLIDLAKNAAAAVMCAEKLHWRCHRRLIADYLTAVRSVSVQHILDPGRTLPHVLTEGAAVENQRLSYPQPTLFDHSHDRKAD